MAVSDAGIASDGLCGHQLAHQGLRISSILMPLASYLGPYATVSRIGSFVIPCVGRYVGAFDSQQLGWELGDRFLNEIALMLGPRGQLAFGCLHSVLEVGFSRGRSEKALSGVLVALYGSKLVFSNRFVGTAIIGTLGMRSFLRGYQSYQEGKGLDAAAHVIVGSVRMATISMDFLPEQRSDIQGTAKRAMGLNILLARVHTTGERAEKSQELKERAQSNRDAAAEHVHQATKEAFNGNYGNAIEHAAEAARDYVNSRCDETLAVDVKSAPDSKWEAMERDGYAQSRFYPWDK